MSLVWTGPSLCSLAVWRSPIVIASSLGERQMRNPAASPLCARALKLLNCQATQAEQGVTWLTKVISVYSIHCLSSLGHKQASFERGFKLNGTRARVWVLSSLNESKTRRTLFRLLTGFSRRKRVWKEKGKMSLFASLRILNDASREPTAAVPLLCAHAKAMRGNLSGLKLFFAMFGC